MVGLYLLECRSSEPLVRRVLTQKGGIEVRESRLRSSWRMGESGKNNVRRFGAMEELRWKNALHPVRSAELGKK